MKIFYLIFFISFFVSSVYSRDPFYLPEKDDSSFEGLKGRLIGIVSSGSKRACLLGNDESGAASQVEEGMTWCGYTVKKIRERSLVLKKGKDKRVLFLN